MFLCHILISFGFIFKLIDMINEECANEYDTKENESHCKFD